MSLALFDCEATTDIEHAKQNNIELIIGDWFVENHEDVPSLMMALSQLPTHGIGVDCDQTWFNSIQHTAYSILVHIMCDFVVADAAGATNPVRHLFQEL